MPIEHEDILHRHGDSRGKRIATAKLVGYSWEAIAEYWGLPVLEAMAEAKEFIAKWMDEL